MQEAGLEIQIDSEYSPFQRYWSNMSSGRVSMENEEQRTEADPWAIPSFKGEVEKQEEERPAKETQPEQQKGLEENQGVRMA